MWHHREIAGRSPRARAKSASSQVYAKAQEAKLAEMSEKIAALDRHFLRKKSDKRKASKLPPTAASLRRRLLVNPICAGIVTTWPELCRLDRSPPKRAQARSCSAAGSRLLCWTRVSPGRLCKGAGSDRRGGRRPDLPPTRERRRCDGRQQEDRRGRGVVGPARLRLARVGSEREGRTGPVLSARAREREREREGLLRGIARRRWGGSMRMPHDAPPQDLGASE